MLFELCQELAALNHTEVHIQLQLPSSFFTLLLVSFSALAPALKTVDGGCQEEAGHNGGHRDGDAREDDNEEIGEGEGDLALPKTVLGELAKRHTASIGGQRALHTFYTCIKSTKTYSF